MKIVVALSIYPILDYKIKLKPGKQTIFRSIYIFLKKKLTIYHFKINK